VLKTSPQTPLQFGEGFGERLKNKHQYLPMKKYLKHILFSLFFLFLHNLAYAQNKVQPEMADLMRSNGKIYVVVGTLAIILAGVLGYLIWIDQKISKIEKK
jgi:CcmD family protein